MIFESVKPNPSPKCMLFFLSSRVISIKTSVQISSKYNFSLFLLMFQKLWNIWITSALVAIDRYVMTELSFPRINGFVTFFGSCSNLVTHSSKILCKVNCKSSSVTGQHTQFLSTLVLVQTLLHFDLQFSVKCPPR